MTPFEKAMAALLQKEGGWVNDPDDSGGETYGGVSRRYNPTWQGWARIDAHKPLKHNQIIKGDPTLDYLIGEVYRNKYWAKVDGYGFPPRLTEKLFDTYVNAGDGAVRILQHVVGVLADGKIGPKTIGATFDALELRGETWVLKAYCKEQLRYYEGIVKRKPKKTKFMKAWTRRAAWIPD